MSDGIFVPVRPASSDPFGATCGYTTGAPAARAAAITGTMRSIASQPACPQLVR